MKLLCTRTSQVRLSTLILRVENADDAYHALLSELEDGDVVMIKGSNATGLGALARRLKGEFSSVL